MSTQPRDTLEQSRILLDQMESAQARYEENLRDSKRALARSQRLLDRLKEMLARGMPPGSR